MIFNIILALEVSSTYPISANEYVLGSLGWVPQGQNSYNLYDINVYSSCKKMLKEVL